MTTEKLYDTPYETIYEDDPTLAPGTEKVKTTPYTGHKVRSYRNLYDGNGNLISSTLEAVSDYKSRNKVILRGPAKTEETTPAVPSGGSGTAVVPSETPSTETPAETPAVNPDPPVEEETGTPIIVIPDLEPAA